MFTKLFSFKLLWNCCSKCLLLFFLFFFLGTAWDNYDVNMKTQDGKDTLHCTVGICYQNKAPIEQNSTDTYTELTGWMRRRFEESTKLIPPFYKSLKNAKFHFPHSFVEDDKLLKQDPLGFLWLIQMFYNNYTPLHTGFFSKFPSDGLPQTEIAYMDPICLPPTRNDVVKETMIRSLKVAKETNQDFAVVSYDLAIALKAYSIQALCAPDFDNLIILLGNFHLEMAFFRALGTFLADSGVEYLLTESGVLAEGS